MTSMKILAVAEFDCARVLSGHRRVLKALGIDYRVAVKDSYWDSIVDFSPKDPERLTSFALEADVLQFHPAIGQPWSYSTLHPHWRDGEDEGLFGIDWTKINPRARRVSYFHGSRNAAVNAGAYAAHWRGRGHAVWTSTLDYVEWMSATYAPPAIFDPLEQGGWIAPAMPRGDDDPLVVSHAPTDPANCHTDLFLHASQRAGTVAVVINGQKHFDCLRLKRDTHAGFDHLRGAFSVNTLENCGLGLAPLVRLRRQHKVRLEEEGFGSLSEIDGLFRIEDDHGADLARELRTLEASPAETRSRQNLARGWFSRYWRSDIVGAKLKKLYEAL